METPDWRNCKILVVEDEQANIDVLKILLKKTGINIEIARDGLEAVEKCTDEKYHIDLVLMDIKLPIMDGIEATKKIRENNQNLPIIAQTAFALQEEEKEIMAAGFDDYITKPILIGNLIYKINKFIG